MVKKIIVILSLTYFAACVESQYYPNDSNYDRRDCHYYGTCGNRYDYDRDRRPYYDYRDRDRDRDHDYDRHRDRDHDRDRDRHDYDRDRGRDRDRDRDRQPARETPPPPKPAEPEIRPSCPSGTQYDGRHCKIIDQKLRRPGGDGNINPCPKGMWVSGDKCVGK